MSLAEFWERLIGHLAFLLSALPLFGAAMVAASAGLGRDVVRRTALTNVLLTFALSVLMVASYDPELRTDAGDYQTIQMETDLPWIADRLTRADRLESPRDGTAENARSWRAAVSLRLGIDGLSLWPIAATCWLMIPAVLAGTQVDHERPAAFYTALLLLQSLVIAAFAALDAVLFLFCLEATVLPLWYLVGRWGRRDRQAIARKLLVFQCAGGLAVFVGLMGLAVAAAARGGGEAPVAEVAFSIPRLLAEPMVAGWIATALVLGFWVRAALFPLHTWFPAAYVASPTSLRMLLTAAIVPLGGFGLARFVLPLVTGGGGPEPPVPVAGGVQALAIAGAVYFGLLALSQSELSRLVSYVCLCQMALAAAGLCSQNRVGATGGVLHLFNLGVTAAVLAVLLGWLERRFDSDDVRSFGGLARTRPRFAAAFTLGALALIAVPGLNGFAGQVLIVWGVFEGPDGDPRLARAAACLAAWLLCAWALVGALVRILFGPSRKPVAFPFEEMRVKGLALTSDANAPREALPADDLTKAESVLILPLALVMLWIGLWPRFFTDRIEPTLDGVLSPSAAISGYALPSAGLSDSAEPRN